MFQPQTKPKILAAQFAGNPFSNHFAQLPAQFYSAVDPTPVKDPQLVALNRPLAAHLGLDAEALDSADGTALFAGNALPSSTRPIAQVYAGHQFGHFNPQLGDGRAILLGDLLDRDGAYQDIQLKGAGPTPYSRSGDGRAALGPVIREYLVSEAMHRLGIKTTRALAAVTTGERVYRQRALPGAVITRVASSHIRIGTFEYFHQRGDSAAVKQLADYAIARHYPNAKTDHNPTTYLNLLKSVITAQAELISRWLNVGFIHGVMNTDNMSISGETIDYGPCAFMEYFDPATVYSSIDQQGRYAYGNQASIALWNLTRLAECLLPLLHEQQSQAVALAEETLGEFAGIFELHYMRGLADKIGLISNAEVTQLSTDFLQLLHSYRADFTLAFRLLANTFHSHGKHQWLALFQGSMQTAEESTNNAILQWHQRWLTQINQQVAARDDISKAMNLVNPLYIPRNSKIEDAINAAEIHNDFTLMQQMMQLLNEPYTEKTGMEEYTKPSPRQAAPYKTFCGT